MITVMIREAQNAIGAQKRVTYPDMRIQGRLPGGSKMLTFKSLHSYSSYNVNSRLVGGK